MDPLYHWHLFFHIFQHFYSEQKTMVFFFFFLPSISYGSCHVTALSLSLKLNVSMWLIWGNEMWARGAWVTSRLTFWENSTCFTAHSSPYWGGNGVAAPSMDCGRIEKQVFVVSLQHNWESWLINLKILLKKEKSHKTYMDWNIKLLLYFSIWQIFYFPKPELPKLAFFSHCSFWYSLSKMNLIIMWIKFY